MMVILTFLFVMVVTAVLFGGWVIMTTIRFVWRAVAGYNKPNFTGSSIRCCGNPGCRTNNPPHARYCRRCGANLADPMPASRAAVHQQPRFNAANGSERQVA